MNAMKLNVIAVSPGGESYMPDHDRVARLKRPSNGSKYVPCDEIVLRVNGPGAGVTDLVFSSDGRLVLVENYPFVLPEELRSKLSALETIGPR